MTDDVSIDLDTYSHEQYAEFFTDLLTHALAGQHEEIVAHVSDVVPTPPNVASLLYGMCQGIGVLAEIVHPNLAEDDDARVELRFGTVDDPVDRLVVEAGGHPGATAVTERDASLVPAPVRWAGQLTSAAIGRDDATIVALVHTIVRSYVDQMNAGDRAEEVDALAAVSALITCLVGFAEAIAPEVYAAQEAGNG